MPQSPWKVPARLALAPAVVLACAAAGPAFALSPSEVFEKVAPSVWAVRGLDAQERPFSYGSAVVIGPGRLITNCHVLAKAKSLQLRRDNVSYEAKLEHADAERNLCMLSVTNFTAPAVSVVSAAQLKVGQRVYAVGNPEKLALTLSEGLISGLRSEDPKLPPLQTSAPISPGSSGGGLFDEQGRLVGITTLTVVGRVRIAQNLNFAVPAEWIAEVPERAKLQLARLRQPAVQASAAGASSAIAAAEGMPGVGTTWKYSYRDQRYPATARTFSVRVTGVEGFDVRESLSVEGGSATDTGVINAKALRFNPKRISNYSVQELAPYLYPSDELAKGLPTPQRPENYPTTATRLWQVGAAKMQSEEATTVPAGTYKTVRVEVTGTLPSMGPSMMNAPARFQYTAWYAPETNRYIMVRHKTWNGAGAVYSDEIVQLLEYSAVAAAARTQGAKIAAAKGPPATAEGLPAVGAKWKYSFRDQHLKKREQVFTIRVTGVEGWDVRESFVVASAGPVEAAMNAREMRFGARAIASGYSVIELAPYLFSSEAGKSAQQSPASYPSNRTWKVGALKIAEDETTVPAGTFKTLKVEVGGTAEQFGQTSLDMGLPARFQYTAWYSPEVRRYVMVRHEAWSRTGAKVGDEIVKLLEYSAN